MTGMTTTGLANLSDYRDRAVIISVTGVCHQDTMKTSTYKVKVPFSRMSETMQSITRLGGTVSNVAVVASLPVMGTPIAVEEKAPAKSAKRKK